MTIKIRCNWKRKFSFTDFLVCSNGFHYTCFAGLNAEFGNLYLIIIIVFNHVIHSCLQASFILYYNTNYCVDWSISNFFYEERTTSLGTELPSLSPQEKSEKGPLTEGSLGVVWLLSLKCNACLSLSLKWDKHCKLVTLTSFARYAIACWTLLPVACWLHSSVYKISRSISPAFLPRDYNVSC